MKKEIKQGESGRMVYSHQEILKTIKKKEEESKDNKNNGKDKEKGEDKGKNGIGSR